MKILKINQDKISPADVEGLVALCPFSAIEPAGEGIAINSGCKMCGICVRQGPKGAIVFEEKAEQAIDKSAWRGIAVYAECAEGKVQGVTLELLAKARELAGITVHPVFALLAGSGLKGAVETLLGHGADRVYVYDNPRLANFQVEPYCNVFADFIVKVRPSSVLVGATNIGRSLAPRVAARLRTGLTADCTVLEMRENTDLVQIRPAFGGNIMAKIITPNHRPQFCTVRPKVFRAAPPPESPGGEVVEMSLPEQQLQTAELWLGSEERPREVDISEAGVIVAVGRGVKSKAELHMAQELAQLLGAQLACTRPLIENGWFDAKRQIGLSGRTVNADLIVTLGISGSVQFAAGMKSSKCIVAVNQDPAAPIFDVAHYGFVGDINEIIPALMAGVGKGGEGRV